MIWRIDRNGFGERLPAFVPACALSILPSLPPALCHPSSLVRVLLADGCLHQWRISIFPPPLPPSLPHHKFG